MTPLDELEEAERAATEVSCGFCDATSCNGHNLVDVNDPAAFWAALTPKQIIDLLRCAPMVAGPWEKCSERVWIEGAGTRFALRRGVNRSIAAYAFIEHDEWEQEAKDRADSRLRAAGWLLAAPEGE